MNTAKSHFAEFILSNVGENRINHPSERLTEYHCRQTVSPLDTKTHINPPENSPHRVKCHKIMMIYPQSR